MINLWAYRKGNPVPVIDLFAGPGGLGEGFSRAGGGRLFRIALSIEMDTYAHQTLTLRAFQRAFAPKRRVQEELVDLMRGHLGLQDFLAAYRAQGEQATREAVRLELGETNEDCVFDLIRSRLKELGSPGRWVLIGGPPCQAYSLAGRARQSRALSNGSYVRERDKRHFLYREYLKIIAEFKPAVFVMENVKGILSSEVGGNRVFAEIYKDLQSPERIHGSADGVKYKLVPLAPREPELLDPPSAQSFVVRSETCGVPQSRHRVIIVGIRDDVRFDRNTLFVAPGLPPQCAEVIGDLPPLRSGLSKSIDSHSGWARAIRAAAWDKIIDGSWFVEGTVGAPELRRAVRAACRNLVTANTGVQGTGGNVLEVSDRRSKPALANWYASANPGVIFNHEARAHMAADLHRYLFAAVFARECGYSPKLGNFPHALMPEHANAFVSAVNNRLFSDRFRVQMQDMVATTVTSHISKDGHGFIHYDPTQCRSLTVREAARLQTFPDDYCFLGPRTAQYHQVGNAVPPYLALQIAEAIAKATGGTGTY
jgi:DNA (cytosine-5)-methyltransferase 1